MTGCLSDFSASFFRYAPELYAIGNGYYWNPETQTCTIGKNITVNHPELNGAAKRRLNKAITREKEKERRLEDTLWRSLFSIAPQALHESSIASGPDRHVQDILQQLGKNGILHFFPWAIRKIADEMVSDKKLRELYLEPNGFTRDRMISLYNVLMFLLTMAADNMNKEMYEYFKMDRNHPSVSAMVQRRKLLKPEGVEYFFRRIAGLCDLICRSLPVERKNDLTSRFSSILAGDGTGINRAYDPEDTDTYVDLSPEKKGYNISHLTALRDAVTGLFTAGILQPVHKINEVSAVTEMLRGLKPAGRILFEGDRGFGSLNLIETIRRTENMDCLIRVKESWIRELKVMPLEEFDIIIILHIVTTQRKCDKKRFASGEAKYMSGKSKFGKYKSSQVWDFESETDMSFRAVRFQLPGGSWETLVTTLSKEEFSIEELKELYYIRWNNIEKGFRILKWDNYLSRMHSKLDELERQEIFARLAMHNIVSCIIKLAESLELVYKNIRGIVSAAEVYQRDDKKKHPQIINRHFATFLICDFFRNDEHIGFDVIELMLRHKCPVRSGRSFKRDLRRIGFFSFIGR